MRNLFFFANLKRLVLGFFFTFFLIFNFNSKFAIAITMDNYKEGTIIEELRLTVLPQYKEAWLHAESEIWEPWLNNQEGFIERQIFYNEDKGEALILVTWENKKLWKKISLEDVAEVQSRFEKNVQNNLKLNSNPFVLKYEGELYLQK